VADPVVKPVNPPGVTANKPAAAPAAAPATPAPATTAKSSVSNAAATKPAPAPITSIDDLIERAEDRLVPKGSTVRVSPDNADASSKARQEELEDSLKACGIKVIWDKSIAKDAILVELPKKS
jgi:hypothetical protein